MVYFRLFGYFSLLVILTAASLFVISFILFTNGGDIVTSRYGQGRKTIFINGSLLNEVYIERIEHLTEACKKYKASASADSIWDNRDLLDHILVDKKHKLLYCYVPKVACTNWKRIFMVLNGSTNETDVLSIPANLAHSRPEYLALSNYSIADAKSLLNTYTKFIFVRHPFERLLSAYRNKLEKNYINSKYFQSRLGRYIIKHYREKPTNSSLVNGDDVTFEEFTAYLTKSMSSMYNEHWKPVERLCEPCQIQYDFIGKYETLITDSNYLLKSIGMGNISFPHNSKPSGTSKDLKKYFRKLSLNRIKELLDIYKLDFKLFSYTFQDLFGYEIA
ncbi:carbohydrate sulfotransferase 11 [Cimex lectularius]|uniref:Carbohydrate sulfotransferase n=1 Tax=Cimex lectularius TaxID=79782 RepID=A0A8I6RWN3_CIMLE|nr:carbohydrate sulfotransferase 11 [Cimex lectularius]